MNIPDTHPERDPVFEVTEEVAPVLLASAVLALSTAAGINVCDPVFSDSQMLTGSISIAGYCGWRMVSEVCRQVW